MLSNSRAGVHAQQVISDSHAIEKAQAKDEHDEEVTFSGHGAQTHIIRAHGGPDPYQHTWRKVKNISKHWNFPVLDASTESLLDAVQALWFTELQK